MSLQTPAPQDADWVSCPRCRGLIYGPRFVREHRVCPNCGTHGRLTAEQRIEQLLDPGSVRRLEAPVTLVDPLHFVDTRRYPDRLAEARRETGLAEAVVCVTGTLLKHPVVLAVMDFRFLGGSLGVGVGEALTGAAETARCHRHPLIIVTASGGARMQEGAFALMQMVKTSQALAELDEAGVLTVSVITDPTYGGVAASFATLSDVILAEPGARIGFAGPRVIRETIGRDLPEDFQTAEFLLARGLVDAVVPRAGLVSTLAAVLAAPAGPTPALAGPAVRLIQDPAALPVPDAGQIVRIARHPDRPTTLDYLASALDEFLELKGDRLAGDCPATVGGIGRIQGRPVMVIGHQKGRDTAERVSRNFGMPQPEGYRKAARLMRLAAKLGLPIVTLIDTPGAHPGIEAEERGQAWAIAESVRLMCGLPVPVVAVVTGEGGSGGALALAIADRVLACANAMYSVISPEGCAAILWKDRAQAPLAAAALRLGARDLLDHGIIDAVIPEPDGGAHLDPAEAAHLLRAALTQTLRELTDTPADERVARRRHRFRRYGLDRPRELPA